MGEIEIDKEVFIIRKHTIRKKGTNRLLGESRWVRGCYQHTGVELSSQEWAESSLFIFLDSEGDFVRLPRIKNALGFLLKWNLWLWPWASCGLHSTFQVIWHLQWIIEVLAHAALGGDLGISQELDHDADRSVGWFRLLSSHTLAWLTDDSSPPHHSVTWSKPSPPLINV